MHEPSREPLSNGLQRFRPFLTHDAIVCGLYCTLRRVTGMSRDIASTFIRNTFEGGQQHGVQSVAALCGNSMKGQKRKHG
jgi:hypothetical protein